MLLKERHASIIMENTSKPTSACFDLQPTVFFMEDKNPPRVTCRLGWPALAQVSFGDWRHTPPLLYTWGIFIQQFFIECVKEMGVLVVDASCAPMTRQEDRLEHSSDPSLQISLILKQVQAWLGRYFTED